MGKVVGSRRHGVDPSVRSASPVPEGFHRRLLAHDSQSPSQDERITRSFPDGNVVTQRGKAKPLPGSHTPTKWRGQDSNPDSSDSGVATISPRPRSSAWTSRRLYGQQKQKQ